MKESGRTDRMKRLRLPRVTLCAVSSVALPETVAAICRCMDQVEFHDVLLLTDAVVDVPESITVVPVPFMGSREAYSHFLLKDLAGYITSSHVLIVQWDGFIIDASRWQDSFLDVDYIGACWPQFDDGRDVGNGGFSLRSKLLLDACAQLTIDSDDVEDIQICRTHRQVLEDKFLIRFASRDLARKFSFERTPQGGDEFGFHGVFNMPDVLGLETFSSLYRMIDMSVINCKDHRYLAKKALRNLASRHGWTILLAYLQHRLRRRHSSPARGT